MLVVSVRLIKSVLFELKTYWAHVFLLRKKVIQLFTSICWTLLWTCGIEKSRRALVAWEILCRPKSTGVLGLINYYIWNKAVLCKHLWVVALKKDKADGSFGFTTST